MYNRILKRPMFRRGGSSFQSQGTGITSPYDVPRGGYYGGGNIGGGMIHGNPMGNRTGFVDPKWGADDTLEQIDIDRKKIFAPKEGEWSSDVMQYLSALSTPYKESGEAKTIGEMGAEGAEQVKLMRKERQEKEDLAKLSKLERELALRDKESDRAHDLEQIKVTQAGNMVLAKYEGGIQLQIAEIAKQNTATGRRLTANDEMLEQELAAAAQIPNPNESAKAAAAAKAKHKRNKDNIISGSDITTQALKIAAGMVGSNNMKSAEEIAADIILIIKILQSQLAKKATGGRVGYQMGTPQTGAMPVQQASLTETIDTPNADFTETETITEGQQPTVQMAYEEFRAAIPPEVNDEIVQLIYYNQDAFADFSQITTQSDVYAFNNKYGVSLVLPMDTETT